LICSACSRLIPRHITTIAIDPMPYTKTFSPALDHLLALQKQVAAKTRRLEEEMKIAERDYAGRLRDMHGDFDVRGPVQTAMTYGMLIALHSRRRSDRLLLLWKARSRALAEPRRESASPSRTQDTTLLTRNNIQENNWKPYTTFDRSHNQSPCSYHTTSPSPNQPPTKSQTQTAHLPPPKHPSKLSLPLALREKDEPSSPSSSVD
jgi:hypothetical protein